MQDRRPRPLSNAAGEPAEAPPTATKPSKDAGPPSIGFVFGLVLVVNLLGLAGAGAVAFSWAQDDISDRATVEALEARGRVLGADLAAAMDRAAARLEVVAERLDRRVTAKAGALLESLAQTDPLVEWAGAADLRGVLVAASGGEGVGAEVGHRTWYVEALETPLVADGLAPVEVASAAAAAASQDRGFLVFAAPVTDRNGRVRGVVAARLSPEGASARLGKMAEALGVEAKLSAASGRTLVATAGWGATSERGEAVGVGALRGRPSEDASVELLMAELGPPRLPELPFRLEVRLPEAPDAAASAAVVLRIAVFLGAAIAIYGIAAVLLARLYLRPIQRLAASSQDIAEGRHWRYPFESRRTREAATLSAALGVIERRLHAKEAGPRLVGKHEPEAPEQRSAA